MPTPRATVGLVMVKRNSVASSVLVQNRRLWPTTAVKYAFFVRYPTPSKGRSAGAIMRWSVAYAT
jgi:hypothetical protein